MKQFVVEGLAFAVVLTVSTFAHAQESEPEVTEKPPAAGEAAPAAAAPTPAAAAANGAPDGVRFRFGVNGGIGFFSATPEVGSMKTSFTYYGTDLRFGAQINNLFAVYAQPTLGGYGANGGGAMNGGGLVGFSVIADATFIDRLFVGAGLGYTVYNSPGGMTPILRVGGYPLMSKSDEKARRKGLMVGVDLRITGLDGYKTIVMPTFNVGYEAF